MGAPVEDLPEEPTISAESRPQESEEESVTNQAADLDSLASLPSFEPERGRRWAADLAADCLKKLMSSLIKAYFRTNDVLSHMGTFRQYCVLSSLSNQGIRLEHKS